MLRRKLPLAAVLLLAAFAQAYSQQAPAKPSDSKQSRRPEVTPPPVLAEDVPDRDTPERRAAAARYAELRRKLSKGERALDFTELRMAYTRTDEYKPYGEDMGPKRALLAALDAGRWDEVLEQSAKILESDYLDVNAHFGAYTAHARKGDAAEAEFHKYVFDGLINSIRGSSDGKSTARAFVVISVDEEHALLRFFGLRATGNQLIDEGGHTFNRIAAVDPETGKRFEYYFQVDKPFNWLGGAR